MLKRVFFGMVLSVLMVGCASDGGSMSVGEHGTDSTLSHNRVEGLYLFKIAVDQRSLTVTSGRDAKVGF